MADKTMVNIILNLLQIDFLMGIFPLFSQDYDFFNVEIH